MTLLYRNLGQNLKQSFQTLFSKEKVIDSLPVTSTITVYVDINLPLLNQFTKILNFRPINLIISQIGSLIVDSIVRLISTNLILKLINDYKYRISELSIDDNLIDIPLIEEKVIEI